MAKLLRIKAQQDLGFKLSEIADLSRSVGSEVVEAAPAPQTWVHYQVAPGVELHISRDVEREKTRKVLELLRVARSIMKEDKDEGTGGR